MDVHGLLLAAGAGRRMGMAKALVHDEAGSWLLRAVGILEDGGCTGVSVVLGASGDEATELLTGHAGGPLRVVRAEDWARGMSASLRAGIVAIGPDPAYDAVLVTLVDLPDLTPAVVRRVLAVAGPAALARAVFDGRPGHPVLLGREHWPGVVDTAQGDLGARDYLAGREVALVECGDLAGGWDVDSR